jgi:hypothetical protein
MSEHFICLSRCKNDLFRKKNYKHIKTQTFTYVVEETFSHLSVLC